VLLAFVLYGNTIGHDYALDDQLVITRNQFTHEGWRGILPILTHDSFVGYYGVRKSLVQGGRYRPLSIATFAIEHQFFHGNPHVSHAVNVLLYGLSGWLLYEVLRRWLRRSAFLGWSNGIPLIATLLFVAHPVHTEAVANIKGRDEVLALFCALGSILFQFRHLKRRTPASLVGAGFLFLLALLAKESVLPFLVLFPLALWFFTPATRSDHLRLSLACVAATLAYALLRHVAMRGPVVLVQPEILNDPFLFATPFQRLATIFAVLLGYLRLLFVPYPLTHDYYLNQVPIVGWNDPRAILALGIHLALAGAAVYGARTKDPIAFGILAYLITISVVSNLLVSVGVLMSERFLYTPSVGVAVAAACGLERVGQRLPIAGRAWLVRTVAATLLAFGILTVMRNPAWRDNLTLFERDVKTSGNSTKLRTALGATLLDEGNRAGSASEQLRLRDEAIGHLRKAVEIYPGHGAAWLLLGNAYSMDDSARATAIDCYRRAVAAWPSFSDAYMRLSTLLRAEQDYPGALATSRAMLGRDPRNVAAWFQMGLTFEAWGKPDSAMAAYESAARVDSNQAVVLAKLGGAYGRRGDLATAVRLLETAIGKGEREGWVFDTLGVALVRLGRLAEAEEVFRAGLRENPESPGLERGLAATYRRMGDEVGAREHEGKARLLEGGSP
jgi:tetratricopeptide (TPR) repeat protein